VKGDTRLLNGYLSRTESGRGTRVVERLFLFIRKTKLLTIFLSSTINLIDYFVGDKGLAGHTQCLFSRPGNRLSRRTRSLCCTECILLREVRLFPNPARHRTTSPRQEELLCLAVAAPHHRPSRMGPSARAPLRCPPVGRALRTPLLAGLFLAGVRPPPTYPRIREALVPTFSERPRRTAGRCPGAGLRMLLAVPAPPSEEAHSPRHSSAPSRRPGLGVPLCSTRRMGSFSTRAEHETVHPIRRTRWIPSRRALRWSWIQQW